MTPYRLILILLFLLSGSGAFAQSNRDIYSKVFDTFRDSIKNFVTPCEKVVFKDRITLEEAVTLTTEKASLAFLRDLKKREPVSVSINSMGKRFSIFSFFYMKNPIYKTPVFCEIVFISDEVFFAYEGSFDDFGATVCNDSTNLYSYTPLKFKAIPLSGLVMSIEWLMYAHLYGPENIDKMIFKKQIAPDTRPKSFYLRGLFKNGPAFSVSGLEISEFYQSSDWPVPKLDPPD